MTTEPKLLLVSIDGIDPEGAIAAIVLTSLVLPVPHRRLLLTYREPTMRHPSVEIKIIPRLDYKGYQEFSVRHLWRHMLNDETHALSVQHDSYGLHAEKWDAMFLKHDYIGAPWPDHLLARQWKNRKVGSSGICIRSRKWLELGKDCPPYAGENDDVFMCQKHLEHYTDAGCTVAPLDLALRFAVENYDEREWPEWRFTDSWGFHGVGGVKGLPKPTLLRNRPAVL